MLTTKNSKEIEDKLVFGKETFTNRIKGNFALKYDICRELGHGSYGKVNRVQNRLTQEYRACKQLSKLKMTNVPKFNAEISIMTKTDHPNIIKLYEVYEDSRYFYLIMEECTGGELFERIISNVNNKKMFSEKQAAVIFNQLMSAICYCHSQKIVHRDLKPENILFLTQEDDSPIKIIDFGLSKIQAKNAKEKMHMDTKTGTIYYISPEVLKGDYDEKCDIWSAGVILYFILSGEPPFTGANDKEIYQKIEKMQFVFPDQQWKDISSEAKDLVTHMLCAPNHRYSAEEVLHHNWIIKCAPNSKEHLIDLNVQSLSQYQQTYKLKKAVLTFIASRLKDEDIKSLIYLFAEIDKNKDGTITLEEMKDGIEKMSIGHNSNNNVDMIELFNSIDTDKSGVISYTEFIAASMDRKLYMKEERLYEAFKMFDKDNSGKISKDELSQVLRIQDVDVNAKDLEAIIQQYDLNGDGEIDYNEFITMMNSDIISSNK